MLGLIAVGGCGGSGDGTPRRSLDAVDIADAVVRAEPKSRYGNPESYVVFGRRYRVLRSAEGYRARGVASWYGTKFHGKRTSSGETYDMYRMTAAHKSLPLPTYVRVTNLENHRQAVVRVNDRGPFHGDRLIDLSYAAAVKLGTVGAGTARVEIEALDPAVYAAPAAGSDPVAAPAQSPVSAPASPVESAPAAPVESAPVSTSGAAPVIDKSRPLTKGLQRPASASIPPAAPVVSAASIPDPIELYIQIGSFRFRENAERRVHELHSAGLASDQVQVQAGQADSGSYYRVVIGPLRDDAELAHRASELERMGIDGYLVIEQ